MEEKEEEKKELAKKEEKVFEYVSADGQKIALTFEIVQKYLVHGKPELLTLQEAMYFLNICRASKLNPFIKDCYLIKYTEKDPAAIVTSIDFFRKRARMQKDCRGWKKGIIVQDEKGKIKDTNGLLLDGEKLLGGWFEAKPGNWDESLRLEVNLEGYLKKTKEGDLTRFWQSEKQPTMIAKVAEAQGLRTLWPEELSKLYMQEEIQETEIDASKIIDVTDENKLITQFDAQIPKEADQEKLNQFLQICADHFKKTIDQLKAEIVKNPGNFWEQYEAWLKKQISPPKEELPKEELPKEELPKEELPKEESKVEPEKSKFPKWKIDFLKKMGKAKEQLGQALKQPKGEQEYYKIIGEYGYEKSNQVATEEEAQKIFQAMNKRMIELLEEGITQ